MQDNQQIILCIPGIWKTHEELLHTIINKTDYIFAGKIIKALAFDFFAEIEEESHNDKVSSAFRQLSLGRFSDTELDEIDQHNMVIYIICDGGNFKAVQNALLVGQALLRAGGLAIKIETAGISHSKKQWLEFSATQLMDLFKAFIPHVSDQKKLYSCGMHQFGKPDACINKNTQDSNSILNQFLLYILVEDPILKTGDTFAIEEGAEKFKLSKINSADFFDNDSTYFNSFGVWSLNKPFSFKQLLKFS
ncbi:DUF4261 domain-containing protein [Acinetobacter gerneri]|uniref:DUF4261 domain-containing protein n=1 Tax=Acinetobacter gerneri DSM 14967 = CIP 107464 = MTCC 9824 TaxID=1120926 RepID=N8YEC8_9GAMM|nr:DUF4261 domain-containing protein [Acinetobacter gerneri]ENV35167.1 hypothetical protein F960_00465 [Acinetobacter gerneri DSM 14967 = CIP 107464 = MTCC 9824]EPR83410.1 hypothetical protein L289_2149 [Acinetobacter gerneri DSM 14967 = CIP 107464 = MTCC 9824]